jgi:hypothetical protein
MHLILYEFIEDEISLHKHTQTKKICGFPPLLVGGFIQI